MNFVKSAQCDRLCVPLLTAVVQLLAEQIWCGTSGGLVWLDKLPSVQKCAEECKTKVGFINLIDYGRPDTGEAMCNEVGCDCRCVTGSCTRTATPYYDLYEVADGKLEGFIYSHFLSSFVE